MRAGRAVHVVEARVTVALTDDTLYGLVREDRDADANRISKGRDLPPGMTVRSASNRPDVVRAAADGTLRTVANGVASITATVDRHGSQQGGILAYEGDDDDLRLGWEFTNGVAQFAVTIEDDHSDSVHPRFAQGSGPISQVLATVPTGGIAGLARTVWFKMDKRGTRYRTWYSTDGSTFVPIYEVSSSLRPVRVGAFAFDRHGTSDDLTVGVDSFSVEQPTDTARLATPRAAEPQPGTTPPSPAAPAVDRRVRMLGTRAPARRSFTVRAGRTTGVTLTLNPEAYRGLVRQGQRRVSVILLTRGSDGVLRRGAQSHVRLVRLR